MIFSDDYQFILTRVPRNMKARYQSRNMFLSIVDNNLSHFEYAIMQLGNLNTFRHFCVPPSEKNIISPGDYILFYCKLQKDSNGPV